MAPIDNGEEKIERVSSEVGRTAGQSVARVTVQLGQNVTRAVAARAMRAAATSLRWTLAAVQKPGGEVSMKELSELPSRTGREVVSLDDKNVMQALEKNLKGRGVHYAIEREKIDGKVQHVLHVRGDDAKVVADSLERAAEAVDAKRERKQERSLDRDDPKQAQKQDRADDADTPKQKQSESTPKAHGEPQPGQNSAARAQPGTVAPNGNGLPADVVSENLAAQNWARNNAPHLAGGSKLYRVARKVSPVWGRRIANRRHDKLLNAYRATTKNQHRGHDEPRQTQKQDKLSSTPKKPEAPATVKRSKAETAQMQSEIRQKVKTRAAEIKTAAPKQAPKLNVPSRGMKR